VGLLVTYRMHQTEYWMLLKLLTITVCILLYLKRLYWFLWCYLFLLNFLEKWNTNIYWSFYFNLFRICNFSMQPLDITSQHFLKNINAKLTWKFSKIKTLLNTKQSPFEIFFNKRLLFWYLIRSLSLNLKNTILKLTINFQN